jgi:hypothetical protein
MDFAISTAASVPATLKRKSLREILPISIPLINISTPPIKLSIRFAGLIYNYIRFLHLLKEGNGVHWDLINR